MTATRGRHAQPPLRLTRRGRIVRDIVCGTGIASVALFGTQISVAFWTFAVWSGQAVGVVA